MKASKINKRLQQIEDSTFSMGQKAKNSFSKTGNINSLKAAVIAYRCSMQSMRDRARFKID